MRNLKGSIQQNSNENLHFICLEHQDHFCSTHKLKNLATLVLHDTHSVTFLILWPQAVLTALQALENFFKEAHQQTRSHFF